MMAKRRLAVKGAGKFKFWFNSSEAVTEKEKAIEHMAKLEKLVSSLAKGSKGRMTFKFIESGSSLLVL